MFCPDGGKGSEATRGFDVADKADNDHLRAKSACSTDNRVSTYRGGLNNCDGFDDFLLVHLRTRPIEVSDDGGHPGLVAHGCCEMNWFLWVILWKAVKCFSFDSLSES